ncbi:hypothetical protein J6590_010843 [Homalodisca vitripennis]|nr:hypothetical protein J6590_010843 [Homalodisca vitripennis]
MVKSVSLLQHIQEKFVIIVDVRQSLRYMNVPVEEMAEDMTLVLGVAGNSKKNSGCHALVQDLELPHRLSTIAQENHTVSAYWNQVLFVRLRQRNSEQCDAQDTEQSAGCLIGATQSHKIRRSIHYHNFYRRKVNNFDVRSLIYWFYSGLGRAFCKSTLIQVTSLASRRDPVARHPQKYPLL